jgi:hypothetical protein
MQEEKFTSCLQPETLGMETAGSDFLLTAWPLRGNNAVSSMAFRSETGQMSGTLGILYTQSRGEMHRAESESIHLSYI